MWGLIIVPFVFNLWFKKLFNFVESLGGILHIVFFLCSMITLLALAKKSSSDYVFKTLTNDASGWENPGVAWGLGLLTITFSVNGMGIFTSMTLHAVEENAHNFQVSTAFYT
jgi:choline transport protein